MKDILDIAKEITRNARQSEYGSPEINIGRIAKLWSVVFDREVTPAEVALCMILVKVARTIHKYKDDSAIDIAGYAWVLSQVAKEEKDERQN